MKNYQTYNTAQENYREAAALQDLLQATVQAINAECDRMEADLDTYGSFTISIHGKSIAFIMGGPQADALYKFIQHIADENLYTVDFDKSTVTGNL